MWNDRIRYFNKHVFNRLMLRSAGSPRSHFAVVGHVGRRSGKTYETPIIVIPQDEHFIIALTYGPKVDWYRNLQATEHSTLRWHGKSYMIGKPEPLDRATALPAFSRVERPILRLLRIQDFARVKAFTPETI